MKAQILLICIMFLISGCSTTVKAFPGNNRRVMVVNQHRHRKPQKVVLVVGTRVKQRPSKSIVVVFKNASYLYADGVYYKPVDNSYEVVRPQLGMIVPSLPEYGVKRVMIKGEVLYTYDNVIYKEIPTKKGIQFEVQGFINE